MSESRPRDGIVLGQRYVLISSLRGKFVGQQYDIIRSLTTLSWSKIPGNKKKTEEFKLDEKLNSALDAQGTIYHYPSDQSEIGKSSASLGMKEYEADNNHK